MDSPTLPELLVSIQDEFAKDHLTIYQISLYYRRLILWQFEALAFFIEWVYTFLTLDCQKVINVLLLDHVSDNSFS